MHERAYGLGLYCTSLYVGVTLGPLLSGYINDGLGWRAIIVSPKVPTCQEAQLTASGSAAASAGLPPCSSSSSSRSPPSSATPRLNSSLIKITLVRSSRTSARSAILGRRASNHPGTRTRHSRSSTPPHTSHARPGQDPDSGGTRDRTLTLAGSCSEGSSSRSCFSDRLSSCGARCSSGCIRSTTTVRLHIVSEQERSLRHSHARAREKDSP